MINAWANPFVSQRKQGTLLNTFTTAKSVINTPAQRQLFPEFWRPGKQFMITVQGALSNIVTTPGTVTFQLMLGTPGAPIIAWSSGAVQLNITAHVLFPFWLDIMLRMETEGTGTASALFGYGMIRGVMFTKTAGNADQTISDTSILVPPTAPVVGTGFDSTIVNTLDFWTGFSVSNSGNGIRIDNYLGVELDAP